MRLRDLQVLSVAYLAFALLPPSGYSFCPVYNITGHPCPGCGMTRALHLLMHGELLEAMRHHALSALLLPVLAFFAFTVIWKRGGSWYEANRLRLGAGLLVGAGLLGIYGLVRFLSLAGWIRLPDGLFAAFSEPALVLTWWRAFFH